jgi:hypothetical protein
MNLFPLLIVMFFVVPIVVLCFGTEIQMRVKNMWKIARAVWKGKGRPCIFRRDDGTNETTAEEDDSSGTDDDTTASQPQQN